MQLCHFPLQLFGLNFNLDLLLQFKDEYVVNDHSQWAHQFHFNTRQGQMVSEFLLNKGLLLAIQRDQTVQCHLQIDQWICQNHSILWAPRIHMVAGCQHKENWSELHALQGLVVCHIRDGLNKVHVGAQCSLQRKNCRWISMVQHKFYSILSLTENLPKSKDEASSRCNSYAKISTKTSHLSEITSWMSIEWHCTFTTLILTQNLRPLLYFLMAI